MENIIKEELLQQDRQRLKTWEKQIRDIDNFNTYREVRQRVNDFIHNNNVNQDGIDVLNDFLNYCKKYYINE